MVRRMPRAGYSPILRLGHDDRRPLHKMWGGGRMKCSKCGKNGIPLTIGVYWDYECGLQESPFKCGWCEE